MAPVKSAFRLGYSELNYIFENYSILNQIK